MLTFDRKFRFTAACLSEIVADTLGATIYADGSFEAATDHDLPGEPLEVSETLAFRVTAKTDRGRAYWTYRLLEAAGEGAALDPTQRGYWGPTDEYEPSWLVTTKLTAITPELQAVIYDWMTAEGQEAVYLEYQRQVVILDREEVPTFQAATV